MELGAVGKLLKLITSEDKNVKRHSLMTLGIMSSNDQVKNECIKESLHHYS